MKYSVANIESNLDFELDVLIIYREFILHFLQNPKWITTLEEDQALIRKLREEKKPQDEQGRDSLIMQFFLIYRIEQKLIVRSNLVIVDWLIKVVLKTKHMKADF